MEYVSSLLLGYLIGSLPTAYLLVKWKTRSDIRVSGSGNVGAMNAFDVTGSKWLGIVVFVVDFVKGAGTVALGLLFFGNNFWLLGVAGIGAIVGHNHSLWIKFKGGRGLSTAAGVMAIVAWVFVALWCLSWTIVYMVSKNLHIANVGASVVSPVLLLITPTYVLNVTPIHFDAPSHVIILCTMICLIIVLRHRQPIVEFLKPPITTSL